MRKRTGAPGAEAQSVKESLATEEDDSVRMAEAEGEPASIAHLQCKLSELDDENAALLKMTGPQQVGH